MSSERICQIEYEINDNLKVNLKTGRLLLNTNIINLFKDEYNLNLNLIYNSNNDFNPNMDSLLGLYFKLDISEYIMRTGNLIYYIDSFDRHNLATTYYSNNGETHKHFGDESLQTLIVFDNDDTRILIKDNNDNIKEFSRLSNQSENTYYYVLTKKQIKLNDNTYLTYYYNYDNENRLTSIYNNIDSTRKIEFGYNKNGLINHIYINYSNKINGVRLKYDINNKIVAILNITNSIEELQYVFNYDGECLKYLVDYKARKVNTFMFSNDKTINISSGTIDYNERRENDNYVSEHIYASQVDNYVSDTNINYNLTTQELNSIELKKEILIEYNSNSDYSIVYINDLLNSSNDIAYIYYYDALGRLTSNFEYEESANYQILKNVSSIKGVELLGSNVNASNYTETINGLIPYNLNLNSDYIEVSSPKIEEFNTYHNANKIKALDTKLIYNISFYIYTTRTVQDNYIKLFITYSDNTVTNYRKFLNLKRANTYQFFKTEIELENIDDKYITGIMVKLTSYPDNNSFKISNLYISVGSSSIDKKSDGTTTCKVSDLYSINYIEKGTNTLVTKQVNYVLDNNYYHLSMNDLFNTYMNYLRNNNSFDLILSSTNVLKPKERIKVSYLSFSFSGSNDIVMSNNLKFINESYNKYTYYINSRITSCGNFLLPDNTYKNLIKQETVVNINNIEVANTYSCFDLYNRLVLEKSENGIIKYYTYNTYNKVLSERYYSDNTLVNTINYSYINNIDSTIDNLFTYNESYDSFGRIGSSSESKTNSNISLVTNYYYDGKNRVNCININDNKNHIRYNNKDLVLEMFQKDNTINNYFFSYDSLNNMNAYFKLNALKKDSDVLPVERTYRDYSNNRLRVVRRKNVNETVEKNTYFDKYGKVTNIDYGDISNLGIEISYNDTNKIEEINDYINNRSYEYNYDKDNKLIHYTEYDDNSNQLIIEVESDDRSYTYYRLINGIRTYNTYTFDYDNDRYITPRINKIINRLFILNISYTPLSKIGSKVYSLSNTYGYYSDNYSVTLNNTYLEVNGEKSDLKEEVSYNINHSGESELFKINYEYNGILNSVSKVDILKKINTIFSNHFEYNYSYNSKNEVISDFIKEYNSSGTIINTKSNEYSYDNQGNILSIIKRNNNIIYSNRDFNYIDNKLASVYEYSDDNYIEYEYDYYGNIINKKYYNHNENLIKEEEFEYSFDRLIRYKKYTLNHVLVSDYSYEYNYKGLRIKKIDNINNNIIDIIYNNDKIIYINNYELLYDNDEAIGININNKTYYYIKDETGNIISLIEDGKEVTRYIYDSYGDHQVYEVNQNGELVLNTSNSFIGNINPIRYKSYYYDNESNLYYLNTRYYEASIGRFISPDSIDYIDPSIINGFNLYCYCNNNPVMYSDPDGHSAIFIAMLIGFVVGSIISGGFEIGRQVYNQGWDVTEWDWKQIGLSALGGAVAGAISAIPIGGTGFLSYLGTFALGGVASVSGGLITGSVNSLETGLIAFGIGGIANVVGRGISELTKHIRVKRMNGELFDRASKIASMNSKDKSLAMWNLIGAENATRNSFKSWGVDQIYNLLSTEATYKLQISALDRALRYFICSAFVSSTISGWY